VTPLVRTSLGHNRHRIYNAHGQTPAATVTTQQGGRKNLGRNIAHNSVLILVGGLYAAPFTGGRAPMSKFGTYGYNALTGGFSATCRI
jgi:hypothetical protein